MKTQVFSPRDTTVSSLVEFYFAVESYGATELRTLPNGRVNVSIVLDGKLEWFFKRNNRFEALPPAAFYPLTTTGGRVRSPGPVRCIGIQFYPHILTLPAFEKIKLKEPVSFDTIYNASNYKTLIVNLRKAANHENEAKLLDAYFLKQFFVAPTDPWIQKVIMAIESGGQAQTKIGEIAEQSGVSIKTLERRFFKIIGLTPKSFAAIIQLHQTTRKIHKKSQSIVHGDLTKALGDGYYDQSHFIKSCLRITGLTPKKLFTHLPGPTTDFVTVD